MSVTPEEIQRVREYECSIAGHKVEPVFEMGGEDPLAITCSHCGKTWSISGEGIDQETHERVVRNQVIGYLKGKGTAREDEAANAESDDARDKLAHEAAAFFLAADDLEREAKADGDA